MFPSAAENAGLSGQGRNGPTVADNKQQKHKRLEWKQVAEKKKVSSFFNNLSKYIAQSAASKAIAFAVLFLPVYVVVFQLALPCQNFTPADRGPGLPLTISRPISPRMFGSIIGKLLPENDKDEVLNPQSESDSGSDSELLLSLERSRKRHLSPGVLRGDRISDLLTQQEASSSPQLKKLRPSPTDVRQQKTPTTPDDKMALTFEDFEKYMERNVNKRLDAHDSHFVTIKSSISEVEASVKNNTLAITRNSTAVTENAEAIKKLQAELTSIKTKPLARPNEAETPSYAAVTAPRSTECKDTAAYLLARRSLRLWPIAGSSPQDIWVSTGNFIQRNLGMPTFSEKNIQTISRPTTQSGPTVVNEALVVFVDAASRDGVMGSSAKLANMVNEQGRPTAGIRIEVPAGLRPAFKTLELYGQQLRARHGPGTRRHIKFNDMDHTLYLNAKLPGDLRWSKITLDVARRGIESRQRILSDEVERRMDINGPAALSASAGSAAPSTWGPPSRPAS